jgi:inner membrane protein
VEVLTWLLLVAGALLMLFEVILPGGISFCIGLSTVILGGLFHWHYLREPLELFFAWCLLSLLISCIGVVFSRFFFGGDRRRDGYDEDEDVRGRIVLVTTEVSAKQGRVSWQGAGWDARFSEGVIPVGSQARVLGRDNITWLVEPHEGDAAAETNSEE